MVLTGELLGYRALTASSKKLILNEWLVDTRKSSLSRKTPRSRQRSRNPKAMTRRPRQKRHWCSHVLSAGHKCQIPRPSSSILKASTPRALFPQSWRVWRHEQPTHTHLTGGWVYKTPHHKSPDLRFYSAGHDRLLPEFYTCILLFAADVNPVDQRLMTFGFPLNTVSEHLPWLRSDQCITSTCTHTLFFSHLAGVI